jgi:hypothetical protein
MNGSSYNWSIAGLPVGNYTLQVSLYSNGTFASSDSDSIMVYANNSGGGGNTGNTGCGYDLNYTFISANVPYMVMENQSFMTSVYVNCEIFNTNMLLTYVIYDANNYTVSSGNHSWTGMNNYSHWNWSIGGLSAGNYTFDAELYTNGTFVASNYGGIMVYANNSGGGGNNSGNQTSPCGNDPSYASVTAAQSWFDEYNIGDNFSGYISTNCALLQESMLLDWNIRNLDTNMSVDNGTFTWTAMNLYETHNVTSTALSSAPAGNYSFEATFSWYNNSSFGWEILSINCPSCIDMFLITNSSSGGGGNNGGNNTLNDAHCLILDNLTMSQSYYVSVNLVNTCNDAINYPGINATISNSQVFGFSNSWWYVIDGNNSIPMTWQLYFDPNLTNGTVIDLDLEATVLNCGPNNSWGNQCPNSTESSWSLQFTFIGNTNTNNTGGNNTGGNNTGGNNTGGNNTGGNNTGGNNTGGNNTGGNNTGGNNTGGNNTGGNNTGGNTTITPNSSPVVSNVSISPVITTVDDTLTCNYNVYDADGDTTVTTVTWSVNGNVILTGSDSISTGYGVGDDVSCGVSATDGQQPSATVSDSTVILPSPDSDSASSEGLPAIGTIGTMAAIAAGVFASRRKDE